LSEIYYRNSEGHAYADIDANKCTADVEKDSSGNIVRYDVKICLPIFKNKAGKRLTLPLEEQVNPDKIVRYLNIKANVLINKSSNPSKIA
jgi:hypothetical protein